MTVDRNKLLNILAHDGIPNQLITAIYNIYNSNHIQVRIENKYSEWKRINQGVRQGCSLSPLLFIIYMNHIIKEWRLKPHGSIPISRLSQIDTLLFADDIVFMATSEDNLQRLVYNFNQMAESFNMEISTDKSKVPVMAFFFRKGTSP